MAALRIGEPLYLNLGVDRQALSRYNCVCPFQENFIYGGLAQLARALDWQSRGHEFESRILHQKTAHTACERGFFYTSI